MSIAGRLTLITSSLNSAPIYHMSLYLLPKTVIKEMDKVRRTFFWQGGHTKRKYHLVKWVKICKSKKKGGLGIKDVRKMNLSLLCKWWWKLENENGIWQEIVKHKYLKKGGVSSVKHKQIDSPMWADLLKVKHIYLQGRKMKINNGKATSVWRDSWLYDDPLCDLSPTLYKLCEQKDILVYQWLDKSVKITFSRWLTDDLRIEWGKILKDVEEF